MDGSTWLAALGLALILEGLLPFIAPSAWRQAFTQLMLNAVVTGVLSPLLSHHGLHLALGMAGFTLLGWLFWRWEARVARRFPPPPSSPTLEPGEQL